MINVLEVISLEKKYQDKHAVKSVSFQLKKGNCTALLGPNGAGKTTTLNMLAGLITPTTGTILNPNTSNKDMRSMIGYLPQYPSFFDWMTGVEYLVFSGEIAGLSRKNSILRCDEILELVGLSEGKNRRIGQYSGGMRQRLGIAQALIHKPNLVILDEPVSALDPFGRREVLELLKKLKDETTILFSTHILNDAEQVCDDVLFLHEGVLIEQGPLVQVKEKHQTPKFNLHFNDGAEVYKSYFVNKEWIQQVRAEGNTLSLEVKELEKDRARIFTLIAEKNLPVSRFESSDHSLEELFMKVMKK
ncbi:ABC transporter ATP-binding protein [Rossellomorea aquimaris]|uniref:ABC transporter ATP-binding protein n=1 Tax=Rossellomorea aquimaris TaxID=189382 RepID=UPI000AFB8D65|nr:ABC transporter ATP-binding protein [Rossellomorea aquimaris]